MSSPVSSVNTQRATRTSTGRIVLAALVVGSALAAAIARADPGDLDGTFGTGGIVTAGIGPSSDEANAVLPVPGNKILVAGDAFDGA